MSTEFRFEITKTIGVISTTPSGWKKELNLVSWNGTKPRYDLREWSKDHQKCSRGITLSKEEAAVLKDLLKTIKTNTAVD